MTLTAVRRSLGWSRAYVASLWGCDQATVADWETGRQSTPPEYPAWLELCRAALAAVPVPAWRRRGRAA